MEYAIANGVDWTLFLNNDAKVSADCLERCMAESRTGDRIAIVGPAITFATRPDSLWFGGGYVSDWFAFSRHQGLNKPVGAVPPSSDCGYIPACCALLSSAAWRSIGEFRSDYFMYYEDTEWCIRARADGWVCRYLGEVLCSHAVSASGGQRGSLGLTENMAYYLARNPLRFALETKNWVQRGSRVLGLVSVYGSFNAWRVWQSRDAAIAFAYLQGLLDAARGRMGRRMAA